MKDDQHLIHLLITSSLIISLTSQRPNLVNTSPSNRSRRGFYQKPNKYMNKSIHRQHQGIGLTVLVCDLGIFLSPKFSGCMAGMDRPIWIGKSLGDQKFNICAREREIEREPDKRKVGRELRRKERPWRRNRSNDRKQCDQRSVAEIRWWRVFRSKLKISQRERRIFGFSSFVTGISLVDIFFSYPQFLGWFARDFNCRLFFELITLSSSKKRPSFYFGSRLCFN